MEFNLDGERVAEIEEIDLINSGEFNLDGQRVVVTEEIDLINNVFYSTDICGLSNSKLVDVSGSGSLVCSPIIDNNYFVQNCVGDDTVLCHGDNNITSIVGSSNSFRIVSDDSVEVVTKRIFRIGDVHVLFDLISMTHQFGMK